MRALNKSEWKLFELCRKVHKLQLWPSENSSANTKYFWHKLSDYSYKYIRLINFGQVTTRDGARICPLYEADYLLNKLRDYDFVIVNLNSNTLSLTSDSLDDPKAAIFGSKLAEVLLNLLLLLVEERKYIAQNKT